MRLLVGIFRRRGRSYRLIPFCPYDGEVFFCLRHVRANASELGFQFLVLFAQDCGFLDERANDFAYVCHNHL
jgi:hypothetical protein